MVEEKNSGLTLPVSILIAAVLVSGSIIYLVGSRSGAPTAVIGGGSDLVLEELLKVGGRDVILGESGAPVTLIEYGDYQCPFCGRFFSQTELLIRDNYVRPGKVRLVYRDLAFLGQESQAAAEAAECAKDQGKFWAYHDALYEAEIRDGVENNGNLNQAVFLALAEEIGLNTDDFTSCVDGKKYATEVRSVTSKAQSLGINATPTFFLNGSKISGAQPYSVFQTAVDNALKQ